MFTTGISGILGRGAAGDRRPMSISFKIKIFLAMGSLCLLLALTAGIALNIISDNLGMSQDLVGSSNYLADEVRDVSSRIKQSLETQQREREAFSSEQEKWFQSESEKQRLLYESILAITNVLADVERGANLMVTKGLSYSTIAEQVVRLQDEIDKFFKMPGLALIDPTMVQGANRAARAYANTYADVKDLDARNVSMTQQIEMVNSALEIGKTLRERMEKVLAALRAVSTENAEKERLAMQKKLKDASAKDQKTLEGILASQKDMEDTVSKSVESIGSFAEFLKEKRRDLILVAAVSFVLGVVFSLLIVRVISRPLARAAHIAKGITEGDFDQEVTVSGTDEIGQLEESMAIMIEKLRANMETVESSADQLDSVAAQVSSSIQEISATMEEINSMTSQNVVKAQQASGMSEAAKAKASQGSERMREMLVAMTEVQTASQQIAKIIKVINDIAFQTKLLALNAAVEAAHAGEQGQGFAVVAEEVRNLAARCSAAANDTTQLIDGPLKKIGYAAEVANKTAESLEEINLNIKGMASLMKEIATASEEQAMGINQTNTGLGQIDSAAQGLACQTEHLQRALDHFRKRDDDEEESVEEEFEAEDDESVPALPAA